MEQFLDSLSPLGNVCSIISLFLSIWLMIQTGKIKKNVDSALERNNKVINYINMREEILSGLMECAAYLIEEHSPNEQLRYLQKMDSCLADLAACYPNLTTSIKRDIDDVRASCNERIFSYIKVSKPLNNIISRLKMEAISL